jgi:hypothetical protein
MANRSDAELIRRLFTEEENSASSLNEDWQDFLERCNAVIMESFRSVCHFKNYSYQPTSEDIYQILEQTMLYLYQDNFKQLRSLQLTEEFQLAKVIGPIATHLISDFLLSRKSAMKNTGGSSYTDEPNNS